MARDDISFRRARIARWASWCQRLGYSLYCISMVVFVVGFVTGLSRFVVTVTISALVAGSVVLAPAIVVGYAVRAADRADTLNDW